MFSINVLNYTIPYDYMISNEIVSYL